MNQVPGNNLIFDGLAPLEPGKPPDPERVASTRRGPDPRRATTRRVVPNGGYVPPPEPIS